MRARSVVFLVALVGMSLGLFPAQPAAAVGTTNVVFSVTGTLPTFPCEHGCVAPFSGAGTGGGHASALVGGTVYDATFTILNGWVGGWADYSEPGVPFCPALGFSSNPSWGRVTLSGGATGIVYRASTPTLAGTVTNVTFDFAYTYVRVGATPVIAITGGWLTVSYFIPGTGPGAFTSAIAVGAGTGVFVVNPVQAALHCLNPGALPFTIIGDATLATV